MGQAQYKKTITTVEQGYLWKPELSCRVCQFHRHDMICYLIVKPSTKLTEKNVNLLLLSHVYYKFTTCNLYYQLFTINKIK